MFYALNINGQVLIDLAGLLERYAILYIEELFKSLRSVELFTECQRIIEDMLEKKFLKDLVTHLITLGLLDKEDEKKVKAINERRNYVAHKNITKINATLCSNKEEKISIPEIDIAMSDLDVLPYVCTYGTKQSQNPVFIYTSTTYNGRSNSTTIQYTESTNWQSSEKPYCKSDINKYKLWYNL